MTKKSWVSLALFSTLLTLCIAEPAFADDVSTKTTGFLQKVIDLLTDIRKPAITITCLGIGFIALFSRSHMQWIWPLAFALIIFICAPYIPGWVS